MSRLTDLVLDPDVLCLINGRAYKGEVFGSDDELLLVANTIDDAIFDDPITIPIEELDRIVNLVDNTLTWEDGTVVPFELYRRLTVV